MNADWLRGDFAGTDVRNAMEALRQTVQAACADGIDLGPLFQGLCAVDPIAGAELAAGVKAIAHPHAVRGALTAAPALEKVMSPGGLYSRLATLVPAAVDDVLDTAIARHPTASWITSLSRRAESVPGTRVLAATRGTFDYPGACRRCAEAGFLQALCDSVAAQPDLEPLTAAVRAMGPFRALAVAAATVHADPDLLVVEAVAALCGPDVDAWAQGLFAQTERDPGFAARYADMLRL